MGVQAGVCGPNPLPECHGARNPLAQMETCEKSRCDRFSWSFYAVCGKSDQRMVLFSGFGLAMCGILIVVYWGIMTTSSGKKKKRSWLQPFSSLNCALSLWEYMWTTVDYVFGFRLHCLLPLGNMKWLFPEPREQSLLCLILSSHPLHFFARLFWASHTSLSKCCG